MKTCKNLLSGFVSALLLIAGLTGCQDHDIPAANASLSYPAGEMALGAGSYTSAAPSVKSVSTPQFAITGVKHNGSAADASIAQINASTGAITLTPATDISALGEYLVSVRMTNGEGEADFADALRLVVKGILFEQSDIAATRGQELTIPVKEAYLVQQQGSIFHLIAPANNSDYAHFKLDSLTCAITVDAAAEAGVYPIDIRIKNKTNPNGTLFKSVVTITVESKPYDLKYTPAAITLIPMEGHVSPKPTLRAATLEQGSAVTFSLLDNYEVFTIDATTGAITLPEDQPLVSQTPKTYKLQVRATNAKGMTSFPDAYTVTVDPNKKADPVTGLSYAGTFPVSLKSGEAWTSERPTVTGSTVGIEFSLAQTIEGVSIDRKTGVVTMAAGHRMPLLTENNTLTVNVRNQGMEAPYAKELAFSIDARIWKVTIGTNNKDNALTVSGISNMDRISFMSPMWQASATSVQIKQGWGKSSAGNYIDANGGKDKNNTDNANQNNDWLISEQITIDNFRHTPVIKFSMSWAYGTDIQNPMDLYIVEINAQNVYTFNAATDQEQSATGTLASTPCNLPWTALDNAAPIKVTTASGTATFGEYAFPIPEAYKGKKVRIALRYWNPMADKNNSRSYRIKDDLRIEDTLPE